MVTETWLQHCSPISAVIRSSSLGAGSAANACRKNQNARGSVHQNLSNHALSPAYSREAPARPVGKLTRAATRSLRPAGPLSPRGSL